MDKQARLVAKERDRLRKIYDRRNSEVSESLYAAWQPAENLIVSERKRVAAKLLHKAKRFPKRGDKCLEIGYGRLGWLADLIYWGLSERDLSGIELDVDRASKAQSALPVADLRVGDATELPWEADTFNLVVVSTVFSSILNMAVRRLVADEIFRVTKIGGVLIWYDLAVNNPRNSDVEGIGRQEIKDLFPAFVPTFNAVTLAPPIARLVAPKSFTAASILSSLPFLKTHFLGILVKN